jgi:glutamate synthase (NADPH/NADH) small chain
MDKVFLRALPAERVELALPDKKPLLSDAEARAEAERCLYCSDAPCIQACPTEIDIPTFIKKIATSNLRGSARTIFEQNILGYSCARVCPVEVLCEGSCVYTGWQKKPISIGKLQRYATQHATRDLDAPMFTPKAKTPRKVACIGAGPASLAFAAYLAMEGHAAVVFEKRATPGGLNATGVAPYKLHAEDALREVEWVRSLGVEIKTGVEIGRDIKGADLLRDYDAVFIGVGLGDDSTLGVPGENGAGVYGATAWIEEMKLAKKGHAHGAVGAGAAGVKGKRVVVIGGGNTAIDVARECALLGADDVAMVYRRGADEMSGYHHELDAGRREGVRFVTHAQPIAFVRDSAGALRGVRVVKMKDGKPTGVEREIPCDVAALAIGQSKLRAIADELPGVALDAHGCIVADAKTGATGNPKVYSGGDCVNGGKEVVNAVADGRNAARFVHALFAAGNR